MAPTPHGPVRTASGGGGVALRPAASGLSLLPSQLSGPELDQDGGEGEGPRPGARGPPIIGATLRSTGLCAGRWCEEGRTSEKCGGAGPFQVGRRRESRSCGPRARSWLGAAPGAAPGAGRRASCVVLRGEPRVGHLGELCGELPLRSGGAPGAQAE